MIEPIVKIELTGEEWNDPHALHSDRFFKQGDIVDAVFDQEWDDGTTSYRLLHEGELVGSYVWVGENPKSYAGEVVDA